MRSTWTDAFRAHLQKLGLSQQEAVFALRKASIRVTPSQVSYWYRGALPREETRKRIERWSKGEVPASAVAERKPRAKTLGIAQRRRRAA
jgi:hypothetical protein